MSRICYWLLLLTFNRAPSQRACNLTFAFCFGTTANTFNSQEWAQHMLFCHIHPRVYRIALYALFNRHNLRNDYNLKMTYQIFSSWTWACVNNVSGVKFNFHPYERGQYLNIHDLMYTQWFVSHSLSLFLYLCLFFSFSNLTQSCSCSTLAWISYWS